jgi:predicted AlkP superfamily pyrophosphatase or phosphodiesterase
MIAAAPAQRRKRHSENMSESSGLTRRGSLHRYTQKDPPGHQPGVAIPAAPARRQRAAGFAPGTIASLLFVIVAAALAGCAAGPAKSAGYSPLILVSLDGYRPDYLERGLSPTLAALARDGVRATAMRPAFPTLTFPNHYTIVTGLYPDHHGIVDNRMTDPVSGKRFVYSDYATIDDPSWWGGEPLWVGVERQGGHAVTMFWPGSDVAIDGVRPEHWLQFDARVTPDDRVRQVLRWIDLPPPERPGFVTLYFEEIDHAAHAGGPDSPQVDAAMREVDAAMGLLVDGLKQRGLFDGTNIVVVSDHGGTAAGPDKVIVLDQAIPMDAVRLITTGVVAGFAPKPGSEASVERAALAPHDHMRCWRKGDVPARLHYGTHPRVPPYICLADDGWIIRTQAYMDQPRPFISNGEHGYDNADPNMRALFVAHGPAFKRGLVVPEFDNVDVYPLLAHILRIRPAANDGDYAAVESMLATPR